MVIDIPDHVELAIPAEHADIHARLENWGRWCRSRPHQGQAMSLEGRYRAPVGSEVEWETAIKRPTPMPRPNDLDGLAVELIWRLIPLKYRKALKLVYVYRCDGRFCCHRLHINHKAWNDFIYQARQLAKNHLTRKT
jgi:hypothetical protein